MLCPNSCRRQKPLRSTRGQVSPDNCLARLIVCCWPYRHFEVFCLHLWPKWWWRFESHRLCLLKWQTPPWKYPNAPVWFCLCPNEKQMTLHHLWFLSLLPHQSLRLKFLNLKWKIGWKGKTCLFKQEKKGISQLSIIRTFWDAAKLHKKKLETLHLKAED